MGTVNRDRMQQLEQIGMACRDAWQGRMAAVQAVPGMPVDMLRDALPTYRSWLGALAAMNQGWLGIADHGAPLLDPMLPWHWLGMGLSGKDNAEYMAKEALRASASTLSAAESPASLSPSSSPIVQQSPANRSKLSERTQPQTLANERKTLPESDSPEHHHPKSGKANANEEKQGHVDEMSMHPQLTPEKKALPQNPFPEERKQVIFRGIDEFAAFVQQPVFNDKVPTQEKPSLELESREGQVRSLEFEDREEQVPFVETDGFRSQAVPTMEKRSPKEQKRREEKHESAISGILETEDSRSASQVAPSFPSTRSVPKISTGEVTTLPAWEQVQAHWEQLAEVPRQKAAPLRFPPAQRKAVQSPAIQEPEQRSPLQRQQPEAPATEISAPAAQQPQTGTAQPAVQAPAVTPMAWMGTPQPFAPGLDESLRMEALMEALTEQLQRDFKRYYGG